MTEVRHCLIVEDHAHARRWLRTAVEAAFPGAEIREVDSVADALAAMDAALPDLALVDLRLPDGTGHTLIEALDARRQEQAAGTKIVVSTVMNDDETVFAALRQGADGYVLKEEEQDSLTDMLRGIHEDRPPLSAEIATRLLSHFKQAPGGDADDEHPLAPRERQILQLLAKGYTVAATAEMLGITYHTASSYVRDIYRKLNITSRAEATLEASRRGLV